MFAMPSWSLNFFCKAKKAPHSQKRYVSQSLEFIIILQPCLSTYYNAANKFSKYSVVRVVLERDTGLCCIRLDGDNKENCYLVSNE